MYEQTVHFVLSQIIYMEHEVPDCHQLESKYDIPDECDIVKLLWKDHSAIGFYTVKLKGQFIITVKLSQPLSLLDKTAVIEPLSTP